MADRNIRPRYARNMGLLTAEGAANAFLITLLSSYLAMYATRMGAGDVEVGLVTALPQLAALIFLLPGTLYINRRPDKRPLLGALSLSVGVFYALCAPAPSMGALGIPFYLLMISLAALSTNIYGSAIQAFYGDIFTARQRVDAYSRRSQMGTIFSSASLVISGLLMRAAPDENAVMLLYRLFFIAALFPAAIEFAAFGKVSFTPKQAEEQPAALKQLLKALVSIARDRRALIFTLILAVMQVSFYMAAPLFFLRQTQVLGADELWLSLFALATNLLGIPVYPLAARWVHRRGPFEVLAASLLGMFFVALGVAVSPSLPVMLLVFAFCGLPNALYMFAIYECLMRLFPEKDRTLSIGVYSTALLAASAAGPMIAVWIKAAFSLDTAFFVTALLRAAMFVLLFALYALPDAIRMKREKEAQKRAG